MPAHKCIIKCICICPLAPSGIVVYRRGIECEALQTAADLMQSPVKRQTKKKIRMNLFFFLFLFLYFSYASFLASDFFFSPRKKCGKCNSQPPVSPSFSCSCSTALYRGTDLTTTEKEA